MYTIEFLQVARQNMVDIARYIGLTLKNPETAENLIKKMEDSLVRLEAFPYSCAVYHPIRPLEHEYRKITVDNYMLLFWVEEEHKKVIISRVVYCKRHIPELLD